jgi:pyruvate dehydrogenase (quinone)
MFFRLVGSNGYSINEPHELRPILELALRKKKEIKTPTLIEAVVDPYEPPMPPKVETEFVRNLAQSFVKGQPYAKRIGLTLLGIKFTKY